jgi:cystathionine beta-lyase
VNADDRDRLKTGTRLATAGRPHGERRTIVNTPVWRASTILFDSVAELRAATRKPDDGLFYGRRGTPSQWSLAEALTELEPGAGGTLLYPSGVAAIAATLLALLVPGDELLMVDSAYEPTRALCGGLLRRMGIRTRFYDPGVGAGIAELIGPDTKLIFLESPGSLTFEVQDVPAIVAVARERGLLTAIDNTWATPLLFPALSHGVDVSILACTKYVVGHSDAMMGSATTTPALYPRLRQTAMALGQSISADDAFLALRGLRTLEVRLRRHEESALWVARWLAEQPQVARVLHPALPDFPGHALWARDFVGASGLFSFMLRGGDDAARAALINGLRHFGIGFSWGGYESLALPVDPHALRTATSWQAEGPLVRLHIGLEDPDDLIEDLRLGLERFAAAIG